MLWYSLEILTVVAKIKSNTLSPTCCFPLFESGSCCSWLPVNTDLTSVEGFREFAGKLFGRASCLFLKTFLFLFRFLRRWLTPGSSLNCNCNVCGKASSPSPFRPLVGDGGNAWSSEAEFSWLSWSPNTITLGLCLTILSRSGERSSGKFTVLGLWSELLPSISDITVAVPWPICWEGPVAGLLSSDNSTSRTVAGTTAAPSLPW